MADKVDKLGLFSQTPYELGVKGENVNGPVNQAIGDKKGQEIDSTYIKDLSVSEGVITVTKGDNSTSEIPVEISYDAIEVAPLSHVDKIGSEKEYGHVKLSDIYSEQVSDKEKGMALSAKAAQEMYAELASNLAAGDGKVEAPEVPLDATTFCGYPLSYFAKAGTDISAASEFDLQPASAEDLGMVKLNDNYKTKEENVGAENSVAASAKAVQEMYAEIETGLLASGDATIVDEVQLDANTFAGHDVEYFATVEDIQNLQGTIDANTLGGHEVEYFATAEEVQDTTITDNLNTKIENYQKTTQEKFTDIDEGLSKALTPNMFSDLMKQAMLSFWPIGSIYMSVKDTNPSEFIGGEWQAWGSGRVPVGIDSQDEEFLYPEVTGGEKTHTLTIAEMPSHNHKDMMWGDNSGNYFGVNPGEMNDSNWTFSYTSAKGNANFYTNKTGKSQAHNIMQPYITCYMWKRVK